MNKDSKKHVDLRSDTVTRPSEKMRQNMAEAEVGDDVYREDPTVLELEQKVAEMLGKEAALFFPSGTMANQTSLLTHTQPGQEVILGAESHIFYYEAGAAARLGGLQTNTVDDKSGCPSREEVEYSIRGDNLHYPPTGLICLENTHNRAGGVAVELEELEKITDLAAEHEIPVHLDGARIFNAAEALNLSLAEIAEPFASVSCCLSKGLGAPVGSLLAGSKTFIENALKNRKILGGGMRQVGVLAAAGLTALKNIKRLEQDHFLARKLAEEIKNLNWDKLEVFSRHTNFVIIKYSGAGGAGKLQEELAERGIEVNALDNERIRLVTHLDLSEKDINRFIEVLDSLKKNLVN